MFELIKILTKAESKEDLANRAENEAQWAAWVLNYTSSLSDIKIISSNSVCFSG